MFNLFDLFELNEQDLKNEFKFYSACTLDPRHLGDNDSGWFIRGEVVVDYYEWVNIFEAMHPVYGVVHGDFEVKIVATSEEAYNHFIKHHKPDVWDYHDI
jgi:hypothetical protein